MKRCTKCGVEKPEEAFGMQASRGRRRAECKECKAKSDKEWVAKRRLNPPTPKITTKRCKQCQEVKPVSEFSPGNPGYFQPRCKACINSIDLAKREEKRRNENRTWYRPHINEEGVMVKGCSLCRVEKPISEFYPHGRRYHSQCKECDKKVKKADYDAHPEKYRKAVLDSARKHPDRKRARMRRWETANRERRTQYQRDRVAADPERFRAYSRMHHARAYEQERLYRVTHRYEAAEKQNRYRARKRNAPRIEKIDRPSIIERDNWTCYLCMRVCTPKNVTLDHVIPLYHGGAHTADNLRVACRSCNCRKGYKLPGFLA